ncbi:UDP-N-acetylglucosamine 2-epimerase [Roseobacter ponti]|uniref:UDP-N-acetylglucosamine 2-epimerase (Hydrolyzing) n=1 Tax=Roseobacter ponti TaxID=1891787 RepID=A0A858SV90_9RHOB|nr:UDP-N-acetylglucosamine 2-epimerase [Roseobacter ponti]QJF52879.1 UDP-N-acetylglucosamine 2-epimerase (hydrolyzing) [Roseobacter ponti]
MTVRRIAFVTTARSDYNTMYPVMRAASVDPEIDARIFCAGMHLVPAFGNTWQQLEADGLNIAEKVDFLTDSDRAQDFSEGLGLGVAAFTRALLRQKPDIICVSGDRIENLSLFVAATALGIPLAHMCGGDITEGALDNQIRHVMTKLAHLHFVSMPEHARRVIQMGEEPWRVTLTGDAAIDVIVEQPVLSRAALSEKIGLSGDEPFFLSTYHPQTLGEDTAKEQYTLLLDALADVPERPVMIRPNIDPGFRVLAEMLEDFRARRPDAVIRTSFDRGDFYGLMAHARFMIGNSSSALWEAPSFALPAINVGKRQAGRVAGENVIHITGLDRGELQTALARARSPDFRGSLQGMTNPYGEGKASELTLECLKKTPLGPALTFKKFHEIEFDPMALGLGLASRKDT